MRTVIEIDGLFDGTTAISDATIVVDDGDIAWVGKRSRAPKTPKGEKSRTVQAPGSFAVPGLINCHSHLTLDGSANFEAETRESEAAAAEGIPQRTPHAGQRCDHGPRPRRERVH